MEQQLLHHDWDGSDETINGRDGMARNGIELLDAAAELGAHESHDCKAPWHHGRVWQSTITSSDIMADRWVDRVAPDVL